MFFLPLQDRLDKELERNLALKVEAGETADSFVVSGRGMMHLGTRCEHLARDLCFLLYSDGYTSALQSLL